MDRETKKMSKNENEKENEILDAVVQILNLNNENQD